MAASTVTTARPNRAAGHTTSSAQATRPGVSSVRATARRSIVQTGRAQASDAFLHETEGQAIAANRVGHAGYQCQHIDEGQLLPVGGTGGKFEHWVKNDASALEELFTNVRRQIQYNEQEANLTPLATWLAGNGIEMDALTYVRLLAFTMQFEKRVEPNLLAPEARIAPRDALLKSQRVTALSEVLRQGIPACAELSLLGQNALQRNGVDSRVVVGIRAPENDFTEFHTYLLVQSNGRHFIWDVSDPIHPSGGGVLPRVYVPEDGDFAQKLDAGKAPWTPCSNPLLPRDSVLFGVD